MTAASRDSYALWNYGLNPLHLVFVEDAVTTRLMSTDARHCEVLDYRVSRTRVSSSTSRATMSLKRSPSECPRRWLIRSARYLMSFTNHLTPLITGFGVTRDHGARRLKRLLPRMSQFLIWRRS
jgi:hypothetical protein